MQIVGATAAPSRELLRVFERALAISASTLNVDRVGVWLYDNESGLQELRCVCWHDVRTAKWGSGGALQLGLYPAYEAAINTRRVVAVEDAWTDARTVELREVYLEPHNIRALMDAPIYREGIVRGVVCHEHAGSTRGWTKRETDFAISVADMIAAFIEQALRTDAEERALQRSRMELLGQLAAGVAHDFSNVLQGISLEVERAQSAAKSPEEVSLSLREVVRHADRGVRLVQQLVAFGKPKVNEVCNVGAVLKELSPVFESLLRDPWSVEVDNQASSVTVALAHTELEQILMNLVVNARDAMPSGGSVSVRATENAQGGCDIDVVDTGGGMSAATRAHIFEPFFTTKPPESGTGLGLAIVLRLVQSAGGAVDVVSEPGKGSRFSLRFPAASTRRDGEVSS